MRADLPMQVKPFMTSRQIEFNDTIAAIEAARRPISSWQPTRAKRRPGSVVPAHVQRSGCPGLIAENDSAGHGASTTACGTRVNGARDAGISGVRKPTQFGDCLISYRRTPGCRMTGAWKERRHCNALQASFRDLANM